MLCFFIFSLDLLTMRKMWSSLFYPGKKREKLHVNQYIELLKIYVISSVH